MGADESIWSEGSGCMDIADVAEKPQIACHVVDLLEHGWVGREAVSGWRNNWGT